MAIWHLNFKFGDEPLPTSASIRTWAQGQGGQVAQSLVHGLLLPEDVQFFSEGTEESLARRLQWHTIVVILHLSLSHLFDVCACSILPYTNHYYNFRLHNWPTSSKRVWRSSLRMLSGKRHWRMLLLLLQRKRERLLRPPRRRCNPWRKPSWWWKGN